MVDAVGSALVNGLRGGSRCRHLNPETVSGELELDHGNLITNSVLPAIAATTRVRPTRSLPVSMSSTTAPLTGVERNDIAPICPYCETELAEIHTRKVRRGRFGIGRGFVFFCSHCRKVLGHGTQWYPFPG